PDAKSDSGLPPIPYFSPGAAGSPPPHRFTSPVTDSRILWNTGITVVSVYCVGGPPANRTRPSGSTSVSISNGSSTSSLSTQNDGTYSEPEIAEVEAIDMASTNTVMGARASSTHESSRGLAASGAGIGFRLAILVLFVLDSKLSWIQSYLLIENHLHAVDPDRFIAQHLDGKGAAHRENIRPVRPVHSPSTPTKCTSTGTGKSTS